MAGTITRHHLFPPGCRIGVAVSGGADSTCLLALLAELAPAHGWALTVLHVNHNWRGAESAADEKFAGELARAHGVPFLCRQAPAPDGHCREEAARELRRGFFRHLLTTGQVDRVALGHTRDDQAETVLFRLLRGAGPTGIAAMSPLTAEGFARPLLESTRQEIEAWLSSRGLTWREDHSNQTPDFARNRIRASLLPQLRREWNPAVDQALARLATLTRDEEEWWGQYLYDHASQWLSPSRGGLLLDAAAIASLPRALARRVARRAIATVHQDPRGLDFARVEQLLELCATPRGGASIRLPGLTARRSFHQILLTPGTRSAPPPGPQAVTPPCQLQFGDTAFRFRQDTGGGIRECRYNETGCFLDWDRVRGSLELRPWRAGDSWRRPGRQDAEPLSALFQRARVPSWDRVDWPVLTVESGIVWTRRFGPAHGWEAGEKSRSVLEVIEIAESGPFERT